MGEYRELPPVSELRDDLACVWFRTVEPGEPGHEQLVLPDACVDIVWTAGRPPVVAGPDTGPVRAVLRPGSVIAGARFRPGRAPALMGRAASDLRNARPALADLWGSRAARRLEESDAAGSAPAMLAALQAALAQRRPDAAPVERWTDAVVRWAAHPAPVALDRLAEHVGLGQRHLRRRVEERFGYGPATLRRVLRLQRQLAAAARHPWSLAELAAAAGYADQAHMTRECRRLAGLTPLGLVGRQRPG
jgi:AraC-like DNA-binding protein